MIAELREKRERRMYFKPAWDEAGKSKAWLAVRLPTTTDGAGRETGDGEEGMLSMQTPCAPGMHSLALLLGLMLDRRGLQV